MAEPLYDMAPQPVCQRKLTLCVNIHCAMNGADELLEHLVIAHGAAPEHTSASGLYVELVHCFGACDIGPNIEFDGHAYDGVTPEVLDELLGSADSQGER
jgi:NADH-quinone oxidoreductase subunit E